MRLDDLDKGVMVFLSLSNHLIFVQRQSVNYGSRHFICIEIVMNSVDDKDTNLASNRDEVSEIEQFENKVGNEDLVSNSSREEISSEEKSEIINKIRLDYKEKTDSAFGNAIRQYVFIGVHLVALFAFFTGFSLTALGVAIALYFVRMFGITGAFHRYFSHKSYKTSRWFQFLLGFLGTMSAQKGPIWWASHHRHHHRYSDQPEDIHSPRHSGFWYAHVGWVMSHEFSETRDELVNDLKKFPELLYLDKFHHIPPILLAVATYYFGEFLASYAPSLGTNGWQMLAWGFFVSTVFLYHGTFCVNSATHIFGTKRFQTHDDSRNNWFVSIITLGEGWHNNHHRYPASERQGMYWWEVDISHYIITALASLGLVWDVKVYPKRIYQEALEGFNDEVS